MRGSNLRRAALPLPKGKGQNGPFVERNKGLVEKRVEDGEEKILL
jgi:hypothetical protein